MWAVFSIFASQRHGYSYQTIKVVAITNTHSRTIDYICTPILDQLSKTEVQLPLCKLDDWLITV